jgi:putative transposase
MDDTIQSDNTRWRRYQTGYHLVWILKYRRKILTDGVELAAKHAIEGCCTNHGSDLLALEIDIDHVPCFVSAAPGRAPAEIVGLLKGYSSRMVRKKFPQHAKKPAKSNFGPRHTTSAPLDR